MIIATTSIRAHFDDFQLSDAFEAESYVPAVSSLPSVEFIFRAVQLFDSNGEYSVIMKRLQAAGFGDDDSSPRKLQLGVKKLLSTIEMARQEPELVVERLVSAFIGLGM